jgi:hypothetical protein
MVPPTLWFPLSSIAPHGAPSANLQAQAGGAEYQRIPVDTACTRNPLAA